MDKALLFKALNAELAADRTLELICVGGFALEYYHLRATVDVDAFYQADATITRLIKRVGDRFGVNRPDELWLNNAVANLNRIPPKRICTAIFRYSHLTVWLPPLVYIIGMKLDSGREQDRRDAAALIKQEAIRSPKQLLAKLKHYGFHPDISLVLEAFDFAYGETWLANYLTEHPDVWRDE